MNTNGKNLQGHDAPLKDYWYSYNSIVTHVLTRSSTCATIGQ